MSRSILRKIQKHLNRMIFNNKTPALLQPVSDSELAKYHIDFEQQKKRIRSHLGKVNKQIVLNKRPRIYAAVHQVNWELNNLVKPLNDFGYVEHYDWGAKYDQYDPGWNHIKRTFCDELLDGVKTAHQRQPIDIFFSYLSGNWVFPDVITEINKLGIITVNFSFDDKLKFWGFQSELGLTGNAEIAPVFDICITCQSSTDISKYVYVGGNPLFFPPAANPDTFRHTDVQKSIPISFIGQKYGVRAEFVERLVKQGIPVSMYGKGWPSGELSFAEKQDILSRSLINLGFGYIDDSDWVVGLKERDFEVPLMGGLYLTTYNPDLESCYVLGDEIECYKNFSDLLHKAQYYINRPEEAKLKGLAGRNRVIRDHTWQARFSMIMGLLQEEMSKN